MHIALTADVYAAVREIRRRHPQAPVFLIGFSIGAYTMTKYVAEADSGVWPEGESSPSHSLHMCVLGLLLFYIVTDSAQVLCTMFWSDACK